MENFVICINNDSNPASLLRGKVYRTLPDAEAESHNMFRIIDEDKSEPGGFIYTLRQCLHLLSFRKLQSGH